MTSTLRVWEHSGSQWHRHGSCRAAPTQQTTGVVGDVRMPSRPDSLRSTTQAHGLSNLFGKAELHLGRTVTYFASKLKKKKKNYGNIAIESVLFFTVTNKEFSPGGNNLAKKFDS